MQTKTNYGFMVEAGKDRFSEEGDFSDRHIKCKVSANDSQEGMCIFDVTLIEKGGPPYHFHYTNDEWFYILEGEIVFKIGDDIFTAKAGDSVFAPRQVPHTYTKRSEEPTHMLVVYQPAGTMEEFYLQANEVPNGTLRDLERLYRQHGMEIVGPAL